MGRARPFVRRGGADDEGAIERVGDAADPTPEGARVVELGGRTLMPGLINAHVHVQGREPEPGHGAEPLLETRALISCRRA